MGPPVRSQHNQPDSVISELKSFSYEELQVATGKFSNNNCIGKGGFGEVYRGTLLNGQAVAIKKLFADHNANTNTEFEAEIAAISRTNHPNLVKMLGYHIDQYNKLLVLELISNNSLKYHLHEKTAPRSQVPSSFKKINCCTRMKMALCFTPRRSTSINWHNRMKIAIGCAKGLEYLHDHCEPNIIHRDIKPENILLCDDFEPKIGDFGLARYITQSKSHLSTNPKGTPGYYAPECYRERKLTKKSDVFAFGMILLELITGKKTVFKEGSDYCNLAEWVVLEIRISLETKKYNNLVDPNLGDRYVENEMYRMINCAAACVFKPEKERPKMSEVVQALQGHMQLELVWRHINDKDHLYIGAPYLARSENGTCLGVQTSQAELNPKKFGSDSLTS